MLVLTKKHPLLTLIALFALSIGLVAFLFGPEILSAKGSNYRSSPGGAAITLMFLFVVAPVAVTLVRAMTHYYVIEYVFRDGKTQAIEIADIDDLVQKMAQIAEQTQTKTGKTRRRHQEFWTQCQTDFVGSLMLWGKVDHDTARAIFRDLRRRGRWQEAMREWQDKFAAAKEQRTLS
ncbi:MAG: hypothetical protein LBL69_02240 [Zoogloeaceae bacterium]|nr:hypothetical protein [Zoogloeaceae bacterium]